MPFSSTQYRRSIQRKVKHPIQNQISGQEGCSKYIWDWKFLASFAKEQDLTAAAPWGCRRRRREETWRVSVLPPCVHRASGDTETRGCHWFWATGFAQSLEGSYLSTKRVFSAQSSQILSPSAFKTTEPKHSAELISLQKVIRGNHRWMQPLLLPIHLVFGTVPHNTQLTGRKKPLTFGPGGPGRPGGPGSPLPPTKAFSAFPFSPCLQGRPSHVSVQSLHPHNFTCQTLGLDMQDPRQGPSDQKHHLPQSHQLSRNQGNTVLPGVST